MEEAEKTPIKINTKKSTTKHGIFKLQKIKNKEKILKESRVGENTLPKRSKDKNYTDLLFRNHGNKKKSE